MTDDGKKHEIYDEDDWELISQYIRLIIEASHLPKWGHYELIDTHKDLNDKGIQKGLEKMTENKRFEFREVNCSAILPKVYDTEKQQYANLFECVHWLNDLHKKNEQSKKALQVAYSTKLTEPTKHTIEQIAKHCGVDLE